MNDRIRGIVISYIQTAVSLLVSFLYVPLLIRNIGNSEYGLYQMVGSLFAFVAVFESSISQGVLKFYCDAKANGNRRKMENVLAVSKLIYQKLAFLSLLAGFFMVIGYRAFYITALTEKELTESTYLLVVLLLNYVVSILNAPYLAAIYSYEKFSFVRIITMISQVMQLVLCVFIIKFAPYALTVVLIQFVLNIVMTTIRYCYAQKVLNVKSVLYDNDETLKRDILLFGMSILLASIADQIFWKTDQIILGKFYNTSTVAVYSVGMQLNQCYMNLGLVISSVYFPKISELNAKQDGNKKISDLFIQTGRISFAVLYLILSGFIVFGKEFIVIWAGPDYKIAYNVALIVMIPFTVDIIQNIGLSILQVKGKYPYRAKLYFVSAILNIISTMIMAKYWGEYGAACSTAVSLILVSGIALNVYYSNVIEIDIIAFWKNILSILIRLLPLIILAKVLNYLMGNTQSLFVLAGKCGIYAILYLIFYDIFAANEYEKRMLDKVYKLINRRDRVEGNGANS